MIFQKGNHPMIPKQQVKISKNPMRAAVGDFPAGSPTVVNWHYLDLLGSVVTTWMISNGIKPISIVTSSWKYLVSFTCSQNNAVLIVGFDANLWHRIMPHFYTTY